MIKIVHMLIWEQSKSWQCLGDYIHMDFGDIIGFTTSIWRGSHMGSALLELPPWGELLLVIEQYHV